MSRELFLRRALLGSCRAFICRRTVAPIANCRTVQIHDSASGDTRPTKLRILRAAQLVRGYRKPVRVRSVGGGNGTRRGLLGRKPIAGNRERRGAAQ